MLSSIRAVAGQDVKPQELLLAYDPASLGAILFYKEKQIWAHDFDEALETVLWLLSMTDREEELTERFRGEHDLAVASLGVKTVMISHLAPEGATGWHCWEHLEDLPVLPQA